MADNRNFCLRYFLNYSTESKLEIKEFLNLVLLLKVKLGFNRFFWLLQLFAIRNISDDLWCLLHWNWVFQVSFVFTEAKSKPLVAICGYCSGSVFATHHMVEQHDWVGRTSAIGPIRRMHFLALFRRFQKVNLFEILWFLNNHVGALSCELRKDARLHVLFCYAFAKCFLKRVWFDLKYEFITCHGIKHEIMHFLKQFF